MDLLPFDLIPIIFNNITSIMDKRQFMKTCVAYHKMTKKSVETLNKQIVIKHFVYCMKNYYLPKVKPMERQPPNGYRGFGGLRFGTMERNLCISHGISFKTNIPYMNICSNCGMLAKEIIIHSLSVHYCFTCNNHYDISKIQIPKIFKPFAEKIENNI